MIAPWEFYCREVFSAFSGLVDVFLSLSFFALPLFFFSRLSEVLSEFVFVFVSVSVSARVDCGLCPDYLMSLSLLLVAMVRDRLSFAYLCGTYILG